MNFLDGHLYPENQQPLIITAAPYAPGWIPSDFPEDIPITMEEQIQKAVDCYDAGATVLMGVKRSTLSLARATGQDRRIGCYRTRFVCL